MVEESAPDVGRFVGCLLGGAIGDALGYPVEFIGSAARILDTHGRAAPARLAYAGPAHISDDTQMTLFTGEGLIRAFQRGREKGIWDPTGSIHRAYRRWYATQYDAVPDQPGWDYGGWLLGERRLFSRRAPGNTCLSALAHSSPERHPTLASPPNDSKGCGAVMRSAPIGLACRENEDAFRQARDAGVLTHGHPSGYLSSAYFASVIHAVVRSTALAEAMVVADGALAKERGREEMAAVVTRVRSLARHGRPTPEAIESIGGGWVGEEALGIALLCALTVRDASPEACADALWRSVAHAGDSDSTGSLTGNLLGAMFGEECLPAAWRAEVELGDVVERIARDLHAAAIAGVALSHEDYPPA
jgi:ADP-ribosylglycohydrolase